MSGVGGTSVQFRLLWPGLWERKSLSSLLGILLILGHCKNCFHSSASGQPRVCRESNWLSVRHHFSLCMWGVPRMRLALLSLKPYSIPRFHPDYIRSCCVGRGQFFLYPETFEGYAELFAWCQWVNVLISSLQSPAPSLLLKALCLKARALLK